MPPTCQFGGVVLCVLEALEARAEGLAGVGCGGTVQRPHACHQWMQGAYWVEVALIVGGGLGQP